MRTGDDVPSHKLPGPFSDVRLYAFATDSTESPASTMPASERVGIRVPLMQGAPNCTWGCRTMPLEGSQEIALPGFLVKGKPVDWNEVFSEHIQGHLAAGHLPETS